MHTRIGYLSVLSFLILSTVIISCRHESYPHILTEADRLTDIDADSSLRLLRSIERRMANENKATKMYWKLLVVKASDKVSQPMCTPSEIETIVEYYSDAGDKEMLPEALYYAGRVFRTCNDAPEARRYFLAAIEAIDKSSVPEDFASLKGKCMSQIGSVYLYQDLCKESVNMYQNAFEINHESNDTVGMIFNLRDVANAYLSMSKPDSSLIYSSRGIKLADEISDTLFLNELYLLRSAARIEQRSYASAKADFAKAATLSSGKPSMAQTTIGARLAYATGDTSGCIRMARNMLAEGNLHDKRWASRILSELTLSTGRPEEAIDLMRKYISLDDSLSKIDRAQTILKMNALYEYSRKENENSILKAQNNKLIWFLWSSLAILASLSVSAILYIRYKRQQHSLMKLKIEKLETLRKENNTKDAITIQHETASIESSDIYREICRKVNSPEGPGKLTDQQWKEISLMIKSIYPDFKERLLSICKMNDNEMKVCLLLKMGFTPTVIAALTCHSKESVSATRRRLFEKAFGKKKSPRDWDDFIRTL